MDLFYPLYAGWKCKDIPLFPLASEAICYQLSRAMKDGVTHASFHLDNLKWFRCCGKLTNIIPTPIPFSTSSTIEKNYFNKVQFYKINNNSAPTTIIEVTECTFRMCLSTFKTHPDYQSSSNSIYGPNGKCLRLPNDSIQKARTLQFIKRPINTCHNLINIGESISSSSLLNSPSTEEIQQRLKNIVNTSNNKTLIISVCAGTSATELQCNHPCLCLDIDKRALFASIINTYHHNNNKNKLFCHFDYSNILSLISSISSNCNFNKIILLYQHPSPSLSSRPNLQKSINQSVSALSTNKKVESIHFVYDFNIKKKTFTYNSLRSLFDLPKKIFISPETQINVDDDNIVYHPLFGRTKKFGWARMRKGQEMTFCCRRTCNHKFERYKNKKKKRRLEHKNEGHKKLKVT